MFDSRRFEGVFYVKQRKSTSTVFSVFYCELYIEVTYMHNFTIDTLGNNNSIEDNKAPPRMETECSFSLYG